MLFFAGSFTPFRAIQIFCAYTGVAVIFVYFYMISYTMGALALSGRQEEIGRNLMTCKIKPDHNAGVPEDGEVHPYSNKFLGTYFSDFLNNRVTKAGVIIAYIVLFAFAVLGILRLEEGLEPKNLTPDNSYYRPFVAIEDDYFSKYGPYVQVSVNNDIDYTNPSVQRNLDALLSSFANSDSFSHRNESVIFWWRSFKDIFAPSNNIDVTTLNLQQLIAIFKQQFVNVPMFRDFRLDVITDEGDTRITHSRFFVQTVNQFDSIAQQKMLLEARRLRDEAPYDVTVFSGIFLFIDQYLVTREQTMTSIGIAVVCMFIVSIIFIPSWTTTFLVTLSTISIVERDGKCFLAWRKRQRSRRRVAMGVER